MIQSKLTQSTNLFTPKEMAARMGKKLDVNLSTEQIKQAQKMGLDPETVADTWRVKDFDLYRIPKAEIQARSEKGEKMVIPAETKGEPLTHEENYWAYKFGVHPEMAKRSKNMSTDDEQAFIPEAERVGKGISKPTLKVQESHTSSKKTSTFIPHSLIDEYE